MNNQDEVTTVESKEVTKESDQNKSAQEKIAEPNLATRLAIAEKEVAELGKRVSQLQASLDAADREYDSREYFRNRYGHS